MQGSDSQSTLNWGKAYDSERSAYTDNCSELLGNIQLPREAVCCSLASCDDVSHIHSICIWLKSTKSGPVGFEKIDFSHFSPCSMQWMFQTPGVSIVHVQKTVS